MKKFILISITLHALALSYYQIKNTSKENDQISESGYLKNAIGLASFKKSTMVQTASNKYKTQKTSLNNENRLSNMPLGQSDPLVSNKPQPDQKNNILELLSYSAPIYPESARRRNFEGLVIVELEVLPTGDVTNVKTIKSSGFKVLDEAALSSVKKWKFKSFNSDASLKINKEIVFQLKN